MNDFTEEKLKEFKEAFELYDKDNDNLLNFEETDCAFKCLGFVFEERELHELFGEFGVISQEDKFNSQSVQNTKINFNSFILFLNKRSKEYEVEAELMESFKSFDKDEDGKLNQKEMKYLLLSIGEKLNDEEIEEMIREVDSTGQGAITYKDFVKILMLK